MSMKTCCVMICFLYLLCFTSLGRSHARQGDALTRLFNAKLKKNPEIDTNLYTEIRFIDEASILPQQGLKENDWIEKLPGQPPVTFSQYGGYVTVDEKKGRALYYYFVEAELSKQSKPLLLWLNGGPGCSSLAYGAMEELGPFRVHSDGKTLFRNPYSWNKVANVLFLESPAGVGFSYSNTTSDYELSGDKMTAKDNYAFLVNWLHRFPEYKNRDFYISGESYAGHYVPQLAQTILQHNNMANKNIAINLKGIIIGNAVINDETDRLGMYDYFWTHAFVSDEAIDNIHKYCDFSATATGHVPQQCINAKREVFTNIGSIDIYNIYGPVCQSGNLTDVPKKTSIIIDPCNENYVYAYLNNPEVQKALHANVTRLDYTWEPCSNLNWLDSPSTVLPLLQEFMDKGLRVWVFSGDTDGNVPVTSTRYSLNKLKLPVNTTLHPWFHQGEVGGYSMVYKGDLTFSTVRGAGHEVPSFKPMSALVLIKHFFDGKPLPRS